MRRIAHLVVALCALALLVAPAALAAERMWVGFHDDPSFRWVPNRADRVKSSSTAGATIMRLFVSWDVVARQRPANPSDPFDPAYALDDIDGAVKSAQENDQEVVITISGTPRWANGNKNGNVMPTRPADFQTFARAMASRYSGRNEGIPMVRFWSIWNEPNLQTFLSPQFKNGKPVGPANYAKLAAAGYAGIKAGSPLAKVAIGETSARGRDRSLPGISQTHSPGRFAQLVAKANPRLKFDAWAHHPYPSTPNIKPAQKVKWPNVSLTSLPQFNKNLKAWFKRKSVPIWVTEYGHQTKPQDPLGVSYSTQAAFIKQSIALAKKHAFVQMFIWFVFQDDPGQPWESGLYTQAGPAKGKSPAAFAAAARPLDARNAVYEFKGRTASPLVTVAARKFCKANQAGTPITVTWRVNRGGTVVASGQLTTPLKADCTLPARLAFTVAKKTKYVATVGLSDPSGMQGSRTITIRGK